MADDIVLDVNMDPSGYLAGAQSISQANAGMNQSFAALGVQSGLAQRAIDAATPKRAVLLAWGGMSAGAAQTEQALSSLNARTRVTGANYDRLTSSMRQLAREYPIGNAGARQVVEQFTRMGVASAGSEKQVGELAKTVTKLSGATGENITSLATGMTELSRATGNTNLDPKRFAALADSVTTISAKSGASAQGILDFSKSIAPMAQSAGLGSTAILGISSSMSRLGEDGMGASTAINKMLTDMSRSVREGSPEMASYAQIVGKTSDEFERLFKANPAEALNQVTEAISKAGPTQGPRMLEMLGLEGPRTMRSLTALTNQGGTRGAIAEATAAYGQGSTDKASQAAFGGLNDSLSELSATAQQLSDALGTPLLRPLTQFVNLLKVPVGGMANVAGNKTVQRGLEGLAYTGIGIMGIRALLGPLSALGIGRQIMTSGPLRALASGWSQGRGITALSGPGSTFASRFGAPVSRAAAEGRLGPLNERWRQFGYNTGAERGPAEPSAYSWRQRLQMARGAVISGVQLNAAMMTGSLYNGAMNDPTRRVPFSGNIGGPWRGGWTEMKSAWDTRLEGLPKGGLSGVTGGLRALDSASRTLSERLLAAGESASMFKRTMLAGARVGLSGGMMTGRLAADGVGLLARGGKALMGTVGGPIGLAMMGGFGLYSAAQQSKQSREDAINEYTNRDISSVINTYRDAVGRASGPSITHGAVANSTAQNIAAGVSNMGQATTVTSDDISLAASGKQSHVFTGSSAASIAAQVRQISPQGFDPSEVQAIKVDLLRQFKDPKFVTQVLSQAAPGAYDPKATGAGAGDYAAMLALDPNAKGADDTFGSVLRGMGLNNNSLGAYDRVHTTPGWMHGMDGMLTPGGSWSRNSLSKDQQETIKTAGDSLQSRFTSQKDNYTLGYATQERNKGANELIAAAIKTGNADAYNQAITQVTQDMSGHKGGYQIASSDIQAAGGDVAKALANIDKNFAKTYQAQVEAQKKAGGEIQPEAIQSAVSKNLAAISPMMSKLFDARGTSGAQQAVAASVNAPGSADKLDAAASAMVDNAQKSGQSMAQLGEEAIKAANNLSEAGQEFAIVKAAQAKAELVSARKQVDMTPADAMADRYAITSAKATQVAKNATQQAEKDQAQKDLVAMDQQNHDRLVARLTAQREYEVAVGRAQTDSARQEKYARSEADISIARGQDDFNRGRTRATEDFNRSQARAEQDYQTARYRTIRDFNISIERTEEDFNTTRTRAIRDFNINAQNAEADYLKSRTRQIRDHNIQVKRMIEDATKSLYDPYQRIQTKATYDAANLMLNIREQNEAMAKQKAQLDQLRKMGLSAQAIDQLGLGKSENAQQVNNLVADFGTDPRQVAQMNALAKQREKAAGSLVTDGSNTDYKRSEEDFARGLKDQSKDYATSVTRSKEAFARQLGDMGADLRKNLKRAHADLSKNLKDQGDTFARSMSRGATDFDITMQRSGDDNERTLYRMRMDLSRSLGHQRSELTIQLGYMQDDIKRSDEVISGDMTTLADATNKAIAGQVGSYTGLIKNDTDALVKHLQTSVIPKMQAAGRAMGIDLPTISSGGVAKSTGGGTSYHGGQQKADGGTIDGWSPHPKADNIPVWATAGEFMQPVNVVNHYGVNVMEAIRQKKIPKDALQGFAEGGLIGFGHKLQQLGYAVSEHPLFGGVHPVHTNGSQHYNKRGPGGGGAIDVNADPFNSPFKNEKQAIDKIVGMAREYGLRTIWQEAGHFNHAHFDIAKSGDMMPVGYKPSMSNPGIVMGLDIAAVTKGLDRKRKGWYGKLRDEVIAQLTAAYGSGVPGGGPGDLSAHGKGPKANQAIARKLLASYGWGPDQMDPLIKLWNGESGWNERADNPSSDAYGIPQALPGSKMASMGGDWRTNPVTQIKWGLKYIKDRPDYGSPAKAWAMWQSRSPHWYDRGGQLRPGSTMVQNDTGKVEAVLTDDQWRDVHRLSSMAAGMLDQGQGRQLQTAGGMHMTVHNNQTITYDQRNDFGNAKITVVSNDPDDMGRKLEKRQTQQRLTQTRGVRRNG